MADVIRQFGPSYLARYGRSMPAAQIRAMDAIEKCRTAALGGHVVGCTTCGIQEYAYHSCRHRSCPRCMEAERQKWVESRMCELLPVPYSHVVFNVPQRLHALIRAHKRTLYPVIMSAAAETLMDVAADSKSLGGTIGVMATLHTWSRTLIYHPHVHCLVPAGSVDGQGRWHPAKGPYLASKKRLAKVFRAKLIAMIRAALKGLQLPARGLRTGWKVHVEQPGHGAETVLHYLARSLYRGPLSDHAILKVTSTDVIFQYPDRTRRNQREMRLPGHEFLRRYLQHVWPPRLHRVRYFGLWSRKSRPQLEALRQELLAAAPVPAPAALAVAANAASSEPSQPHWLKCPHCKGLRIVLCKFGPGATPPALPLAVPSMRVPPPAAQPP